MIGRRFGPLALTLATLAALAGCEGGDMGTPTPTPSPTPGPTPSPTPSPTAPLTVLPTPVAAAGDSGAGVPLQADPAPGTTFPTACRPDAVFTDTFSAPLGHVTSDAALAVPQLTDHLHYSQTTKRYTFIDFDSQVDFSISFGPEHIDTSQTTAEQTVFRRTCANSPAPAVYTMLLFNPGAANPTLKLDYASFGLYSVQTTSTANITTTNYAPFGYALPTNVASLNRSGTATYTGVVRGKGFDSGGAYDVTGALTTSVDFTNKTFSTKLDLTVRNAQTGGTANIVTVNFNQTGTPALTSLTGSASTFSGDLVGVLAGPQAEELALAATLTVPNPQNAASNTRIALSGAGRR